MPPAFVAPADWHRSFIVYTIDKYTIVVYNTYMRGAGLTSGGAGTMSTLSSNEQAGIEQFRASLTAATPQQREMTLARLRSGAVAKMPGAPSQAAIDAMIAILAGDEAPAVEVVVVTADAAPTTTPAGRTRVAISASGREFAKAINWAKKVGGTYDAATKTWLIPSSSNFLNAPGLYGWRIVK